MVDNKDATLISGTDQSELETGCRNFCDKKLRVSDRNKAMTAVN